MRRRPDWPARRGKQHWSYQLRFRTVLVGEFACHWMGTQRISLLSRAEDAMQREHLVMFCYCDIAGQVRGKGFPVSQLAKRLRTGIGWTPTNIMLTAFGPIAESPWGPFGDLLLMPDPATQVDVDFGEDHPV